MTDKQPESLRLANALDDAWAPSRYGMARNEQAAARELNLDPKNYRCVRAK